jgi:hypothetical protein
MTTDEQQRLLHVQVLNMPEYKIDIDLAGHYLDDEQHAIFFVHFSQEYPMHCHQLFFLPLHPMHSTCNWE